MSTPDGKQYPWIEQLQRHLAAAARRFELQEQPTAGLTQAEIAAQRVLQEAIKKAKS
jgi:hypothetical protein